jgi:phosphoribosylamine--glycine ligase
VSSEDKDFVLKHVLLPVIRELKARGNPFVGVLYAGLIKTTSGIRVIEFNARFGDPETQVILERLENSLGDLLRRAASGELHKDEKLSFNAQSAVTVVMAAQGYPQSPSLGAVIHLPDDDDGAFVLHAGTANSGGKLVASGGRILNVVGVGPDLATARSRAYSKVREVKIQGAFYRSDIAAEKKYL